MSENRPSAHFYDDKNVLGAKAKLFAADENDVELVCCMHKLKLIKIGCLALKEKQD